MKAKYILNKINKDNTIWLTNHSGRNFFGRICVAHQSSGHKRLYKKLDMQRKLNLVGVILKIYRGNYHSAYLALILYANGLFATSIISENVYIGDKVFSGFIVNLKKDINQFSTQGSCLPLKYINLFTHVNCIESYLHSGFKISRAAGTAAMLIGVKENDRIILKLNSGWLVFIEKEALACVGRTSNLLHKYDNLKKAGKSRYYGVRPTVRGIIKNPCDHPHGGGEGKNSPPAAQVSPWGKLTKGTPTTNTKIARLKRRLFKKN